MSALIRCHPLDSYPEGARASGPRFARIVGECGQALNRRYHTRAGAKVHASDLFGTAYATQDLRAVLRRLDLRRVDLYGDSYGSWFVQAFIARFPGVLRSVILDSTYSAHALNPYYASSASSGRAAMDRVCERDPGCVRAAGGGSATHRLSVLLRRLRRRPLRGTVPGLHGRHSRVIVGPRQLADLVQDAGSEPTVLRDLDASVRAALGGDAAPLLRLVLLVDGNGSSSDPRYFSDGMYVAVSCTDYPQLFSLNAPPSVRARQFRAAVRRAHTGAFAPFTAPEWVSMSGFSQPYDICLDWPRPVHHAPVIPARGPAAARVRPAAHHRRGSRRPHAALGRRALRPEPGTPRADRRPRQHGARDVGGRQLSERRRSVRPGDHPPLRRHAGAARPAEHPMRGDNPSHPDGRCLPAHVQARQRRPGYSRDPIPDSWHAVRRPSRRAPSPTLRCTTCSPARGAGPVCVADSSRRRAARSS